MTFLSAATTRPGLLSVLAICVAIAVSSPCPGQHLKSQQSLTQVPNAQQPRLALTSDQLHVVYGQEGQIFYQASDRQAIEFSPAVSVASVPKLALGRRRGPRISVAGDSIVVTAISHESGSLFAWRSVDQGQSWQEPVVVNHVQDSAKEGLHDMAADSKGRLFVVWLDHRSGKMELYGALSSDQGQHWQEQKIYQSPDGNICECCHPTAGWDDQDQLHILWRNSIHGNRDIYHCHSEDGKTFSSAICMGTGHWDLKQCPMDGGDMVATQGKAHTVWRRGSQIIYATDDTQETSLDLGEQPVIGLLNQQPIALWLKRRGGKLMASFLSPTQQDPVTLTNHASDPQIVGDQNQTFVVWESTKQPATLEIAEIVSDH